MNKLFLVFIIFLLLISCLKRRTEFKQPKNLLLDKAILSSNKNFRSQIIKAIDNGIDTIFLEEGEYKIESNIYDGLLSKNISIIGKGKVILNIDKSFMYFTSSIPLKFKLDQGFQRKSNFIKKNIIPFSYKLNGFETVFLYGASTVEEGWNYKKGELLRLDKILKNGLSTKDSAFFSYTPNENVEVTIFSNPKIIIKNIEFRVNQTTSLWSYDQVLRFKGCRVELDNITIKNKKEEFKGYFCGFLQCNDVKVTNFNCSNLQYGLGFDYSLNVNIDKVYTVNTHHPIVPATFTKNVSVSNMSGLNSTLDAHLSINTKYKDISLTTGSELFNCRSFGVNLENVHLTPSNKLNEYNLELGVSSLNKAHTFLYDEYDIILKNVTWLPQTINFNGLNVYKCRNYIIENCTTNMISTTSFLKSFSIKNSKMGRLYVYDSNVDVTNCTFDQKLQKSSASVAALSLSFNGIAKFKNCEFFGYESLFSFLSNPSTEVLFSNCKFNEIVNFCQKFEYSGHDYDKIQFTNCLLNENFLVPSELKKQKASIKKQQTIK